MRINCPAFEEDKPIPSTFTCQGENHNPPLEFFDIPSDAQSLVLIMDDPDATMGTFTHWLIWNIPPHTLKFDEGLVPDDCEEGLNSSGQRGYMGPCPKSGNHRYFFKLYALNKRLSVSQDITKEQLEDEINSSLMDKAELMGTYQKQQ